MSRSHIFETLAALGAGAIILTGCAGAPEPVKGTDVPGATPSGTPEATPTPSGQPAAADTGALKADATPTPSATPAAPAAMPMAKDMPKTNKTVKVKDSARKKPCQAGCGEGTCGGC
jgi:hypothetical protein